MIHTTPLDKAIDKADQTGILQLNGRNLRQFPMSAQDLSDLQDTLEADISMNRFDKIPREICMFSGLQTLNCHHNSIKMVPDYITYLGNLQYLDLSRNYISTLPPEICRLNLVTLNLSCNRLVSLPVDIGQMTSLKKLDLSCNLLSDLPEGFCNLIKLKHLNLHQNELKELPQGIGNLPLTFLDISTNCIKRLPCSLANIRTLITLEVKDNPLELPSQHVCVRGRIHIFKYLRTLQSKGEDPNLVYHPTPGDVRRKRGVNRRSRPPSGYSITSTDMSEPSFADEMHRFYDTTLRNFATQEMRRSDTDLSSQHMQSLSKSPQGQRAFGLSPGRKRANPHYATLPRQSDKAKTIKEEDTAPEDLIDGQSHDITLTAPENDNKKVSGRSLPGEAAPRSGSWNTHKRRTSDGTSNISIRANQTSEDPGPVISKTPDIDRKPEIHNFSIRSSKSTSDVNVVHQSPPPSTSSQTVKDKDTGSEQVQLRKKKSPEGKPLVAPRRKPTVNRMSLQEISLIFQEGSEEPSGEGDEQLTPTADDQPMTLETAIAQQQSLNGLEKLTSNEGSSLGSEVGVTHNPGSEDGSVHSSSGATPPSSTPSHKDGDGTLTRPVKKPKPLKKRNSSTSSGSGIPRRKSAESEDGEDNTKYRTSICTDGGEELKQIMRKRSLPRNKVNFTVRRQEMNMMHGFKKMMEVKTQMEGVLGVTMGDDLLSCLDDGIYLCQLINKLQPGVIPVVHTPPPNQNLSVPKKTMNIDAFVGACKKLRLEQYCSAGEILNGSEPMKLISCIQCILGSMTV